MSVLAVVAVPNALAFRFTDAARIPPTGVTGQPFSHALETLAGCKGVYMDVISGSLPPGLSLVGNKREDVDGSDWRIAGVPTVPGEYGFWIRAQNLCPGDSTEEDFKIVVIAGLSINNRGVPSGTVGTPYPTTQLTAAGGGSQSWSITAGTLPAGLSFAPNGIISGTPTAAVSTAVTFQVRDGSRTDTETLTFNIRDPLTVSGTVVPAAMIDEPFTYAGFRAAGGSGGNTWSIFGPGQLPAGINLDAATGALSGTPTVAGNFPVVVRVTDNEGRWKDTSVVIRVASPLEITTTRVATLRKGRIYSLAIRTTGGVAIRRYGRDTFNWKVVSGRLPLGLRLNTRVGRLIGTPRKAGVYRVTLEVSDRFTRDTQSFVITVRNGATR